MTIKHFSLCGGGIVGLVMYGIVKRLNLLKVWKHSEIESIYCCSIGSIIGLIIILDIEWDWVDDFWIKRPWNKIFNIEEIDYFRYIDDKGIFDETTWMKLVTPLLKCKKMSPDITLLELYRETNIEYNIYITNMNNVTKTVINYKTFPDMRVTYAIYITTCIPYVCKPAFLNGTLYIDGGLTNNVPINDCLFDKKCDQSEVINITNELDISHVFDLNTKYTVDDTLLNDEEPALDISAANINANDTINDTINNTINDTINDTDNDTTESTIDEQISDNTKENDILDISSGNMIIPETPLENNSIDSIINTEIDEHCNVFQFSMFLLKKMACQLMVLNTSNNIQIENTIYARLTPNMVDVKYWLDIIFNGKHIATCIKYGEVLADSFYRSKINQ